MNWFTRIANRIKRYSARRKDALFIRRFKSCGNDVSIRQPVCFEGQEKITIGDKVSIAAFVHMWGHGGIKIGSRVMIASHVAISTITHDHSREVMFDTLISKPIFIGDDVWIGSHAVILPGVTLGRGSVVGAGSVVTKDVPVDAIVVGVPAVVVNYRKY